VSWNEAFVILTTISIDYLRVSHFVMQGTADHHESVARCSTKWLTSSNAGTSGIDDIGDGEFGSEYDHKPDL
jgi:hypothetical protein